eukprot:3436645-Amphidinium_carterae.1
MAFEPASSCYESASHGVPSPVSFSSLRWFSCLLEAVQIMQQLVENTRLAIAHKPEAAQDKGDTGEAGCLQYLTPRCMDLVMPTTLPKNCVWLRPDIACSPACESQRTPHH